MVHLILNTALSILQSNQKLHQKADRVLIDALQWFGVLKKPDAKWKTEFIDNTQIQSEVLESYSKIVKPGGKMVYATCSILPSENQDQIEVFN
jgi:16S rRNA (cytosine967-C5)-methyltransferase